MSMSNGLDVVIRDFASLNRSPGATWTDATKRKAR